MNVAPQVFTTADDPCALTAPEAPGASVEAALISYAEAREVGPILLLTPMERRRQALWGLQHVSALGPDRGASFISIHHKMTFTDGRAPVFPGNAHRNFNTALEDAFFWANKGHDVYWAMGAQAKPGEHYPGKPYPTAIRGEENVVACKNLYMDIDVKPDGPGKAYVSTREAAEALIGFLLTLAFAPTMIVGSGTGGFHVYWRLGELITPAQFKPMATALVRAALARGLKFDAQCTSDVSRLLRVPGTRNFKGEPSAEGKPVTIIYGGA
jgi:hypothetical protein